MQQRNFKKSNKEFVKKCKGAENVASLSRLCSFLLRTVGCISRMAVKGHQHRTIHAQFNNFIPRSPKQRNPTITINTKHKKKHTHTQPRINRTASILGHVLREISAQIFDCGPRIPFHPEGCGLRVFAQRADSRPPTHSIIYTPPRLVTGLLRLHGHVLADSAVLQIPRGH